MKNIWDIVTASEIRERRKARQLKAARAEVNKFFANLETRGGVIGNRGVLFVYNEEAPEKSYILTETI